MHPYETMLLTWEWVEVAILPLFPGVAFSCYSGLINWLGFNQHKFPAAFLISTFSVDF